MTNKDYLYLVLIVLFGFALRFHGLWGQGIGSGEIVNLVFGTLSIVSMFFVGLEFEGIKKGKNAALICALITAVAPFLINAQSSAVPFFAASLALFFALGILNQKAKKGFEDYSNWLLFLAAGGFLIYLHHWGAVFILASIVSLYIFKTKKSSFSSNIIKGLAVLLLLLPTLFYTLVKMKYIDYALAPFESAKILFTFTDFFSFYTANNGGEVPSLNALIHNHKTLGVGFLAFVILPSLIALGSIIKDYFKPKSAHFYLLTIILATVLAILVASLAGVTQFITSNLIEIYPILILLMGAGFFTMKSHPTRVALITLFVVLNLFYHFVKMYTFVNLIGNFFHSGVFI